MHNVGDRSGAVRLFLSSLEASPDGWSGTMIRGVAPAVFNFLITTQAFHSILHPPAPLR
jgi:hypothetical protein